MVAALGWRAPEKWQLGSHADRLAQRSHAPVLVMRDPRPFLAWVTERRPLRVLLGADFSRSSDVAMEFIDQLREFGPCQVTAVHLYWPPQELARLGIGSLEDYLEPMPKVSDTIAQQLTSRLAAHTGAREFAVLAKAHLGRPGDRLAEIASENEADLIVVGCHARNALGRLWEGSVAGATLHAAVTSVACIPLPSRGANRSPRVRSVLVATDRSAIGDAAVPLAYSLVEPGGTVHIAHVLPNEDAALDHDIFRLAALKTPSEAQRNLYLELRELIPENDTDQITRIHLLESDDTAQAICQAAERLDVDLICLGTHGRSGLARAVLGSVAQKVLAHSARPITLVRRPRQ